MKKRWFIYPLLILFTISNIQGQEVITGLSVNKSLKTTLTLPLMKKATAEEPVSLPFSDDFSADSLYPSTDRWSDNQVFINNTFSVLQPSQGIATFDCLDEYGNLYDNASETVFAADQLTSVAIDLNYSPSDSIYLSFLYEAGGLGDTPETNDSLTLSFWAPDEEQWYSIWKAYGGVTDGFIRVMIPVKETRFLKENFRFRFTGYASLSGISSEPAQAGNADQWNIDYVLLDKDRSVNDTVNHDVALTLPQRSLLNEYEAMPWRHFRQAYLSAMSSTIPVRFRNNDTIVRNVTRHISISDMLTGSVVRDFDAGASNIDPLSDAEYDATLLYTYSSTGTDSALFLVTVSLITDDFDPKQNDTIRYVQRFTDYFAIDDGTAEAGYGISGQGANNACGALRFRAFLADSVTSIRICFNDAYENANQRSFNIMVWNDNNGTPGDLLGSSSDPLAEPGEDRNGFVTYSFDEPVYVSGYYWIGWEQNSETFLNFGLDMNSPNDGRMYYMLSGTWYESQVSGTVMIRPVMKGSGTSTSSDKGTTLINDLFSVYPNPTTGEITIIPSDDAPEDFVVDVFSLSGARIMTLEYSERYDLSRLTAGTYILLVKTRQGQPVSLMRIIKVN